MRRLAGSALLVLGLHGCAEQRAPQADSGTLVRQAGITRTDSLLRAGDAVYRKSPDSARKIWTLALDGARASRDSASIARALTGLGQSARQLGDFPASRRLGEEALALKLRLGMSAELFRSYNALGLLAWYEERLGDATRLFTQAADAARAQGDSVSLVKAMSNSGLVAMELASFERARVAFESARDAARRLGDTVTWGTALTNLGALHAKLGDPIAAIAALESARQVARLIGDSTVEVNARGQMAIAYDVLGEPQRAFALLDSALSMARRDARRHEEAENLKLIADLFSGAGDHQRALDYYRRALAIGDTLSQPEERANILRNEARAHTALGNLALARQRATEALRLHRAAGLAYPQIADLIALAELSQRERRLSDAEARIREARAVAARLAAPVATARIAIAEASVAADAGQWARVLRTLDAVRGTLALAGSPAEAEALTLRARAHAQLGQLDAGIAVGRQAIAVAERVRGNYASGELRTTYMADKARVYAQQVMLLLRARRVDEAFEVADAARGRALLEHLNSARGDVRASRGAVPLLEREQLLRRIDALVIQLQSRDTVPPRERSATYTVGTAELRDSLLGARAEYEALLARAAQGPGLTTALAASVPPSAARIRAALDPDEVLLEYFAMDDQLLIFVVTAQGISTHTVDESAASLASRVHLARELMRRRDQVDAAASVLRALHGILVAPIVSSGVLHGAKQLVVIPHGALSYLPFGALIDPSSAQYVAQRFAILRLATSASLPALRSERTGGSTTDVAEVFAPLPDSLPATRGEVQNVARTLRDVRPSRKVTLHIGGRATEARFREALARGGIVHVATHARLNGRNPLFSQVDFAASSGASTMNNGRVEVHELLSIAVDAPLVFLSGCETALGPAWSTRFETGQDYTTIGQALLYMGARNVVATLWRIDDEGAAAFANAFYSALGSGETSVPDAVARAQRQLIADPRFKSPYYWAPYEITGSGVMGPVVNVAGLSDKQSKGR